MDSATPDPNDYLMVDTQFFTPEFKKRLLSYFTDFDSQCDGLLIHSENFQALNLLQERYREQVKCIYIDPPYNTGSDGFIYRDNFQHSCWLSMMEDRLKSQLPLLLENSIILISIDYNENYHLRKLANDIIGANNFVGEIYWESKTKTQNTETSYNKLQPKAEMVLVFTKGGMRRFNLVVKGMKEYPLHDSKGDYREYVLEEMNLSGSRGRESMVFEITDNGVSVSPSKGKQWKLGKDSITDYQSKGDLFIRNGQVIIKKRPNDEKNDIREPFWGYFLSKEIGTTETGKAEVNSMVPNNTLETIKPSKLIQKLVYHITDKTSLVLDYFGGSGTTAHAVINLNREDGGSRKYLLVEMGTHFDTVLKPRIEKVVYSPDWKDGKPTSFDKGVSHCFKYIRLESYEDTLNNLELPESDPIESSMPPSLREDYMLHYLLDTEANASLLDIDMFKNPFGGYRLNIKRPGSEACDETPVDLIETFNYLIGLRVSQYYLPRRYSVRFKRAVDPELPGEEGSRRLVLDGRPKLDDAGKWSFLRLEGVVPAHPLNPNNGQTKRVLVIWRNLTGDMEQDNAVLDWFADDLRLNDKVPEYDIVYVNGCNNLGADRKETDSYQVRLIEEEFFKKMWEGRQEAVGSRQ